MTAIFRRLLSRQLADAFRNAGGKVDFRVLGAYGSEGTGCRKPKLV